MRKATAAMALSLLIVTGSACGRSSSTAPSGTDSSPTPAASHPSSSPTAPPTHTAGSCSAATLPAPLPPQDLPAPVAKTRNEIAAAATACDYDVLGKLAMTGSKPFIFQGSGDPGSFWRQQETASTPTLATLVKLLGVPPERTTDPAVAGGDAVYVWPAVAVKPHPVDADWNVLVPIFGADSVAKMKAEQAAGQPYVNYRTGITEAGEWFLYTVGD